MRSSAESRGRRVCIAGLHRDAGVGGGPRGPVGDPRYIRGKGYSRETASTIMARARHVGCQGDAVTWSEFELDDYLDARESGDPRGAARAGSSAASAPLGVASIRPPL